MKKNGFVMLIAALAAFGAVVAPGGASAQVQVNIGIKVPLPPLPRFVFPAPPVVVVIPETYMYVVPDVEVDIVFYHGYWYRPHAERWYRATSYNGPWTLLSADRVPSTFVTLTPEFRHVKPEHERIPYKKVRKNWKRWEKERSDGQGHGKAKGHNK